MPVESVEYNWHDDARNRDVPVKIYYPATNCPPCPVIVFSHGLGGSRDVYSYLGNHWASHGYVSVHPTHHGSDTRSLIHPVRPIKNVQEVASNPENALNRPKDVSFVIDRLTAISTNGSPLAGRLNLDRIGVAGHSFGGQTALACAGALLAGEGGAAVSLRDSRVKAAIAMSAPAQGGDEAALRRMYGAIRIPCFHMTGTRDSSPIGVTKVEDRRIPFDHIAGVDEYLLTLAGGDHMIFSGRPRRLGNAEKDPRFHELILLGSTVFWDAYLRGNAAAREWFSGSGFERTVGADGTFEKKLTTGVPR